MSLKDPRTTYSKAELLSDGIVHVLGLGVVVAAVPTLITVTTLTDGRPTVIAASAIYAASLALMVLFSAIYNMNAKGRWSSLLQRLDHSAIYLKIAGTFTPLAVLTGLSGAFLGGIWGAAIAGVALKLISPGRFRWIGLCLYLAMGWVGVGLGWHAFSELPNVVILLMVVGGLLYTGGVAFYLWDALPFHNTIWHGFVLTATLLFYAAVFTAILLGVGQMAPMIEMPSASMPGLSGITAF